MSERSIEYIHGKPNLTVPSNCSIETPYNYPADSDIKAIRFEIKSMEKLDSLDLLQIAQQENIPGVRIVKSGVRTVAQKGYFKTITAYSNKKQMNKPILKLFNPYPIIPLTFERANHGYYLVEAFNAVEFTDPSSQMTILA